ncbi:hypothetical protein CKO09_10650 [Chromatium weissei]|nr:hypothetical protein [Chromatium weissei]
MSTNPSASFDLATLNSHLPPALHAQAAALAGRLLPADAPLRVILLGAFSVGKSSLLNMLIGETLLQTAREETTALPTFIEYGATRALLLINSDGSTAPLDDANLARVTTQAPEGAACASITLPMDWLRGLSIIDLPGLGGLSARHGEYTTAQIQQADAVLYLIAPRGPDADDIATLRQISQYGKRVKLLVTRWDEIEEAARRGEQRPDLSRWAQQIEQQSGLRQRLTPASRDGTGRDDIRDFLERARNDRSAIRLRRLCAELRPLLENALGQNAAAQTACATQSEAEIHALRGELLQRRQTLLDLRVTHQTRAQQERDQFAAQAQAIVQQNKDALERALMTIAAALQTDADWDGFVQEGTALLRGAVCDVARDLSASSADYGDLALPEAQVAALNLRLPPPVTVESSEFLDHARINQLQQELEAHRAEYAAQMEHLARLPEADLNADQQALRDLLWQRDQLATQPLPRIMRQIEGSNTGASVGRAIGNVADIALIILEPMLMASKLGAVAHKIGSTMGGNLRALEMLSLGYWGERAGSLFDTPPQQEQVVDPEAKMRQQALLNDMEARARELRQQLARQEDLANERQLTGWALEQNQREQAQLQARLTDVQRRAAEQLQAAEQTARAERQQTLQRHVEEALAHWRRNFAQQTAQMLELLRVRVRDEWETRVAALLSARLTEVETLQTQLEGAPAARAAALAQLQTEAAGLRAAVALVN